MQIRSINAMKHKLSFSQKKNCIVINMLFLCMFTHYSLNVVHVKLYFLRSEISDNDFVLI
jgi:hypothetical protein